MNWFTPTTDIIRALRTRDGENFTIPQEFLNSLLMDQMNTVFFPIYALDGQQVGWTSRAYSQKIYSQSFFMDLPPTPRFTSWTPSISQIVYGHRKICIAEGPFDALALAPIIPWVISANTSKVQQEILDWCDMWKLHVFTALDQDKTDPKTGRKTGQIATETISNRLEQAGCTVTNLTWPTRSNLMEHADRYMKDPASAFALMGSAFHSIIMSQVHTATHKLK